MFAFVLSAFSLILSAGVCVIIISICFFVKHTRAQRHRVGPFLRHCPPHCGPSGGHGPQDY